MPDISNEITAFQNAVYGKDVRQAIVDLANKLNDDLDDALTHELSTVDATLTQSGAGADAKVVGDKFAEVANDIDEAWDAIPDVDDTLEIRGAAADALVTGSRFSAHAQRLTALEGTTSTHTSQIGTINTTLANKADKSTVTAIQNTIPTLATKTETSAFDGRLDTVEDALPNLAPKASPVFTGSISLGRKSGSTTGAKSIAVGTDAVASGASSSAFGKSVTASGEGAHAEGTIAQIPDFDNDTVVDYPVIASGIGAHAEGMGTNALSPAAHAEGIRTTANAADSGAGAHSEGVSTSATSVAAHAEGSETSANGLYSHAEGDRATASGDASHAEGQSTTASGDRSHAGGIFSVASGDASFAHGRRVEAASSAQFVCGRSNVVDANSKYIFIVGIGDSAGNARKNGMALDWDGNLVLAGGLILQDTVTGTEYKLTVANGQIALTTV